MGTSATYPRDEEVGLTEEEVAENHVRRELHHDAREGSVDGPAVAAPDAGDRTRS